jgi:hypothetical protein
MVTACIGGRSVCERYPDTECVPYTGQVDVVSPIAEVSDMVDVDRSLVTERIISIVSIRRRVLLEHISARAAGQDISAKAAADDGPVQNVQRREVSRLGRAS